MKAFHIISQLKASSIDKGGLGQALVVASNKAEGEGSKGMKRQTADSFHKA